MENPFKNVIGKIFNQKEIKSWTAVRFVDFLRFLDFHIEVTHKDGRVVKETYTYNEEIETKLLSIKDDYNNPWCEFIQRLNFEKGAYKKLYIGKLTSLVSAPLNYLKDHPAMITDEMKVIMENRPIRFYKYLKTYFLQGTNPIVTLSPDMSIDDLQKKQKNTFIKMINLHEELVDSIKTEGVENLTSAQKFTALPKLVDAIAKMAQKKPSNNMTINIGGSAREKEEAMLAFVKQQDEE